MAVGYFTGSHMASRKLAPAKTAARGQDQSQGSQTARRSLHTAETAGSTPAPATITKRRQDWEAVEREYRTGQFSLRELEAKHGTPFATINKRAKREGWTQDLQAAVRQATNAKLIESVVTQAVHNTTHNTTQTVLAAAEVNKQIILGHRQQAVRAREAMEAARSKLLALGDTVADIREAATFVSATESLSRTTKTVIDIERTAFGLDDKEEDEQPELQDQIRQFVGQIHESSAGRLPITPRQPK